MWISNGTFADVAVVWAQTDDGIRGFAVPTDTPGFSARLIHHKLSLRASETADSAYIVAKSLPGRHVRLIASETADSAYIVAKSLPGLPDGKVYQVWMVKDDSPTSQGVFVSSGSMVMKGLDGADRVAITVEPKGGSKQPSTPPIATLAV